jgi:hypothetical protein
MGFRDTQVAVDALVTRQLIQDDLSLHGFTASNKPP